MSTSHRFIEWMDARRDIAFDLIRIYLGVALLVRGWLFIGDTSALVALLSESVDASFFSAAVAHYVALAHIGGGLLLALGLLTRVAALVQIPVLIGAVFFVHLGEGLLATGQSLELASLVLFLLVVIFLHGSGRLSLDYVLFEREQAQAIRETQADLLAAARPTASASAPNASEPSVSEPTASEPVLAAIDVEKPVVQRPAARTIPPGCTCGFTRDRHHPHVRAERRYGMRALRFLTGTTGTPREVVFRCMDCRNVVEASSDVEDIAYYTYR